MKIFFLIMFSILTFAISAQTDQTIYIGQITVDSPQSKNDLLGVLIEFRLDTVVIASDVVKQDGKFRISAATTKPFDIYYRGIGVGETFVQTIQTSGKDTIFLNWNLPKVYKKRLGKALCPKCNTYRETIPILYGMNSAILIQTRDSNGKKIFSQYDEKNYYDGNCVTTSLDPQFFCKRNLIKF